METRKTKLEFVNKCMTVRMYVCIYIYIGHGPRARDRGRMHSHRIRIFSDDDAGTATKQTPKRKKRKQTDSTKKKHKAQTVAPVAGHSEKLQLHDDQALHATSHTRHAEINRKRGEIATILGRSDVPPLSVEDSTNMPINQHFSQIASWFTTTPHDTLSAPAAQAQFSQTNEVVIVTREWEEKFLHEPAGASRPCANFASGNCFAALIRTGQVSDANLTLCEFYTKSDYERIGANGWNWPKETKPCLLCLRAEIYSKFIETRCNANGCISDVNYATIGNIVGQPGEYTVDSCFLSRPELYEGILHPVVIPTIHDYEVVLRNGCRHLKQLHSYPENDIPSFFF